MRRGDLFRVRSPGAGDPKRSRVFVVVSRQTLIDSRSSTIVCAPVYTRRDGLATQVEVGLDDGLKHESMLTDHVGSLAPARIQALDQALRVALALG